MLGAFCTEIFFDPRATCRDSTTPSEAVGFCIQIDWRIRSVLTHSFFGPYITAVETRLSYQERMYMWIWILNFICDIL